MAICVDCNDEFDPDFEEKIWNRRFKRKIGLTYDEAHDGYYDDICCDCLALRAENDINAGIRAESGE